MCSISEIITSVILLQLVKQSEAIGLNTREVSHTVTLI